jgi:hypothetical protein
MGALRARGRARQTQEFSMKLHVAVLFALSLFAVPTVAGAQLVPSNKPGVSPTKGPQKRVQRKKITLPARKKGPSKSERQARGAHPVTELPGITSRDVQRLREIGVKTMLSLKRSSLKALTPAVGKARGTALKREATAYIGRAAQAGKKKKKKKSSRRAGQGSQRPNLRR